MLRVRGHLRGEERRHLGGHGSRQDRRDPRDRRRGPDLGRYVVLDASRWPPVPCRSAATGHASRPDPGRRRRVRGPAPRSRAHEPLPTFAGTPPFPTAARAALADEQLRRNLHRATTTIRTKRARAIAELDDWEELRLSGAAIKDDVLARLPELLVELEGNVIAAGGV